MITFSLSTLVVEAFGSLEDIAQLKALIVFPELIILIPAMMATGISGRLLSVNRKGRLIDVKQKRMMLATTNGMLILVPSALVLNYLASHGYCGNCFFFFQTLELIAGAGNLTLMILNVRDGLKLSGRNRKKQIAARSAL